MKRSQLLFSILILLTMTLLFSCKKKETYETSTSATDTTTTTTTETSATDTSMTTTTGTTATGAPLNDKDKDFVNAVGKGGMAEVALAQDALSHVTNADVKTFAQKMVDDHTKANQELTQFATSRGITLPAEVDPKMKEAKERLMKLTGSNFDQAFVRQMIDDHKDTIKKFEDESKEGQDADLKKWVDSTLPTLRDHLKMAQDLQAKIGKR